MNGIEPWRYASDATAGSELAHLVVGEQERVVEKAGYVFEARLRRSIVKDGRIADSLLYAKISHVIWHLPRTTPSMMAGEAKRQELGMMREKPFAAITLPFTDMDIEPAPRGDDRSHTIAQLSGRLRVASPPCTIRVMTRQRLASWPIRPVAM
jgi:hypothetical protein